MAAEGVGDEAGREGLAGRMRCLGPLCSLAGVAAGCVLADLVDQVPMSAAIAILLLLSNAVPDEADSTSLLGLTCGLLGTALGYGLGAATRAFGQMGPAGEWSGELLNPVRMPLFFVFVTIFHFAEFAFTVAFHQQKVQYRAFLLTPVPMGAYSIAMIAALAEFWLTEAFLSPFFSLLPRFLPLLLLAVGSLLSLAGWLLRTAALFTAQSNFTHLVAFQKTSTHELVRHGVYRLCRHPGYVGWFMWSVSTQLVLGNTICLVAYAFVSWRFFAGRIPSEEAMLVRFFGEEYIRYAEEVPCGIPFISTLP